MSVVGTHCEPALSSGKRGLVGMYLVCFALILGLLATLGLADKAQGSPSDEQCVQGAGTPYRINTGGLQLHGPPVFCKDTSSEPSPYVNAAVAGNKTFIANDAVIDMSDPSIPAGTPEAVFKSERFDPREGEEMAYAFPVEPGAYEVRLYFAEIFGSTQSVGARKFDVLIEGETKLDDYDVFAEAGGGYKGIVETFTITSDGTLDIGFKHEVQNPSIKAIEVLPATEPVNQPPVLQPIGEQSATEGQDFSVQLQASDPDKGDVLSYEAQGLPAGLTVDPQTGKISGEPALGTAANSPYTVEATVSDGATSDSESFTLTVSEAALPEDKVGPAIAGLKPSPGAKVRDRTPAIRATVLDAESELGKADIKLYVDGKAKAFSYDPDTGKLGHASRKLSYGKHTVRVAATDGAGNRAVEAWSFKVVRRR